ncbi:site-specific integrase [Nocardioides stalactiti]|uniref:site-specific integrase n=1 Tax=Nocardioides stalactiti TaxID=2755356 RepID=UPI00160463A3|nr:site-specific integrase [Nocardioides stalactiti]
MSTDSGPRYRAVLDVAPPGAKRRQITRTFRTLGEARDFVTQIRAGISTGTYVPPSAETVAQLSARWVESRRDVREVTRVGYRGQLAPALRHLGDRRVQDLTVTDVEDLIGWLGQEGGARGQGLGPRSVRAALVALAQVLDLAMREGTISTNVVRLARKPRVRTVVGTDLEHWQPADLVRFVSEADHDPLAAPWRLTACGLTRADVLGLRWSDVDLENGIVTVSQGRVAVDRTTVTDDPKSASRRRSVPVEVIWPGTVTLLRSLSARQARDRLAAGSAWSDTGLVVVDALGTPLRPEVYSDRFRRLCKSKGLPEITLHSVRHSLAFWLHSLGVTPADAAALLGHTVDVHLATYLPHSGSSGILSAATALGRAAAAE